MDNKGYISKRKKGTSLYEELHKEALEILQKLSGEVWTDYNEHDPGVTLLENISYAITEVAHKAKLPIQDLLHSSKGEVLTSGDNGFFVASDILTTSPITFNDYRKLWIDLIPNVKNVWIYPVDDYEQELQNLKGLLHVFVEKYNYHSDPEKEVAENENIKTQITNIYHENRNLCEDLYGIEIFKPLSLTMQFRIVLTNEIDGEEALANILHTVNNFLAPEINYHSLDQLRKEGLSTNEIFNGPSLENGFIKDESLKDPLEVINLSDIIKVISKIKGVVNINYFSLSYINPETKKEQVIEENFKVPKNMTARVAFPSNNTNIIFENSEVSFHPNLTQTKKQLSFIQALDASKFKAASNSQNQIAIPEGKVQDINYHYPIRKQLPELYGVGDRGISASASPLRQAQAKQLKAYLLPFDQLIINFLAQLSNIYKLYDFHGNLDTSYFTNSLPDIQEILELIEPQDANFSVEETKRYWDIVTNDLNGFFDNKASQRLNKVADQLLARYNESFQTYSLLKINTTSYQGVISEEVFKEYLLAVKQEFIRAYGGISYNRAKSFNYKIEETDFTLENYAEIPGVFKKIALLTGISELSYISVTEIIEELGILIHPQSIELDIIIQEIEIDTPELHIEIEEVSVVVEDDNTKENLFEAVHFVGKEHTVLNHVLKHGINADNYSIKRNREEDLYYILHRGETEKSTIVHISERREEAIEVVKKVIDFLLIVNQKSETFFVLEHTMLLPSFSEDYFGFELDLAELDSDLDLVLVHPNQKSLKARDKNIDDLIEGMLNNTVLYSVESITGAYRLSIRNERGEVLAISKNDSLTEFPLRNGIEKLKKSTVNFEKETIEEIVKCHVFYGTIPVDETFFSFRMSLMMPSWSVRFQNENFRKFFENTVYEELPIHIRSDLFWLSFNDVQIFESYYFKWLELLKIKNPDTAIQEEINEYAYELITIVQKLNAEA
ncbi:hypothetical protein [uncultured Tenacibaculum sp.]|uniref:hypothetical protein n=1 Tax=uncultured Tenacibaculum sp. TaxID=174713 RepID=UPI0026201E42|nr:hypothetical protein [uncultured Tenacibaculum sp.]